MVKDVLGSLVGLLVIAILVLAAIGWSGSLCQPAGRTAIGGEK